MGKEINIPVSQAVVMAAKQVGLRGLGVQETPSAEPVLTLRGRNKVVKDGNIPDALVALVNNAGLSQFAPRILAL